MSRFDDLYLDMTERIINEGYYDQNRTGIATYKLPHQVYILPFLHDHLVILLLCLQYPWIPPNYTKEWDNSHSCLQQHNYNTLLTKLKLFFIFLVIFGIIYI